MPTTLVQLVARADGGQFVLTSTANTNQVAGSDPLQTQFKLYPWSAARTYLAWSVVYRTRRVKSLGLVVPTPWVPVAQQRLLDAAWFAMDSLDFRMGTYNVPYNGLLGQPNQPQYKPGGSTTPAT